MKKETSVMGTKATDSPELHTKGGKTGSPGGVGAGKMASTTESTNNTVNGYSGPLAPVGAGECICEGNDSTCETTELGATKHGEKPKVVTVEGKRDSLPADLEESKKS